MVREIYFKSAKIGTLKKCQGKLKIEIFNLGMRTKSEKFFHSSPQASLSPFLALPPTSM